MALAIAAGNGRNAMLLARSGFKVEALGISDIGLRNIAGRHPLVQSVCVDLDRYDLACHRYSLILNIRYLNHHIFSLISQALIPGGFLICETYVNRPEFFPERHYNREHLLNVNELLPKCIGLEVAYHNETFNAQKNEPYPLASLVAINR